MWLLEVWEEQKQTNKQSGKGVDELIKEINDTKNFLKLKEYLIFHFKMIHEYLPRQKKTDAH